MRFDEISVKRTDQGYSIIDELYKPNIESFTMLILEYNDELRDDGIVVS